MNERKIERKTIDADEHIVIIIYYIGAVSALNIKKL